MNRSITQWGEESGYTAEVQKQELGRGQSQGGEHLRTGREVHDPGGARDRRGTGTGPGVGEDPGADSRVDVGVTLAVTSRVSSWLAMPLVTRNP